MIGDERCWENSLGGAVGKIAAGVRAASGLVVFSTSGAAGKSSGSCHRRQWRGCYGGGGWRIRSRRPDGLDPAWHRRPARYAAPHSHGGPCARWAAVHRQVSHDPTPPGGQFPGSDRHPRAGRQPVQPVPGAAPSVPEPARPAHRVAACERHRDRPSDRPPRPRAQPPLGGARRVAELAGVQPVRRRPHWQGLHRRRLRRDREGCLRQQG